MNEKANLFDQRLLYFVIAGLLILTAWGNAVAMLTVATIALFGLAFFKRGSFNKNWPVVLSGFVFAAVVIVIAKLIG